MATKAESAPSLRSLIGHYGGGGLARRQVSPIMGAREYGFDKDRDLSRVQPSQNSTAASGLNGLSGLKLGFIEPSPSISFFFFYVNGGCS